MKVFLAAVMVVSGCFNTDQEALVGYVDAGPGDAGPGDAGPGDGGPIVSDPALRKPNVMLLIDKSGSMNFAADETAPNCTPQCNQSGSPACDPGCRTRLQALKTAMTSFLTAQDKAHFGMAIFPTATAGSGGVVDTCGATSSTDIRVPLVPTNTDVSADLIAAANNVKTEILNLSVGGGTPTGESLKYLGTYAPLLDPDPAFPRDDFVILVTDGLPNCNTNNTNTCTDVAACKCTLIPATSCTPASFCTQGCLDSDSSVAQITALRAKGIKTIVVGFGSETATGHGPDTLNAMAQAGGYARKCPGGTDGECGANNSCDTSTHNCTHRYFQATSAGELENALTNVMAYIR